MTSRTYLTGEVLECPRTTEQECSVYMFPPPISKLTHCRSASHGGTTFATSSFGPVGKSALKQTKGHQRAFSQGQIVDNIGKSVGSRVGSKTDFILPAGHRSYDLLGSGNLLREGHSRQASRSESIYTLRHHPQTPAWKQFMSSFFPSSLQNDPDSGHRTIVANHLVPPDTPKELHPNGAFADNKVRTTKYTFLSFLPKNLLEQFHRVANLYFIFIVLLNWFPSINAFGKEIAMIPVMFVLGVTAVKDLFEDRRRHASDKRINNSTCRIYYSKEDRYKKVLWKEVKTGDFIHLSNNEVIPADVVLLKSSDPQGLCYIDTCNIDGESNLKQRKVPRGMTDKDKKFVPSLFRSVIEVDPPTTKIYRFHGTIVHPSGERIAIGTDNLLLRECVLKNTDFVEGIVVYAGHETKAMLNNNGPRYKRSSLERKMNTDIMWCVVILILLCLIGALGCNFWLSSFEVPLEIVPFLPYSDSPNLESYLTFLTFIIILQVMIPLSLYVTIEMTKLLQVYHIHRNEKLYDPLVKRRVECRALNITEELGQVQYIFSDKTGTLTENKMLFRRCTIAGVDYNHTSTIKSALSRTSGSIPLQVNQKMVEDLNQDQSLQFGSMNDGKEGTQVPSIYSHSQCVREFLLVLALCNTVVVCKHPHHDIMDASGAVETSHFVKSVKPIESSRIPPVISESDTSQDSDTANRYHRLAESRSVTPSPVPLQSYYQNFSTDMDKNRTSSELLQSSVLEEEEMDCSMQSSETKSLKSEHKVSSLDNSSNKQVPSLKCLKSMSENMDDNYIRIKSSNEFISVPERNPGSDSDHFYANIFKPIRPKLLNVPTAILTNLNKKFLSTHRNGKNNRTESPSPSESKPIYEAESPDELALVETAYMYNCRLVKRTPTTATVSLPGDGFAEYEILNILPFDSNRKCMSIIIRHPVTRQIILYCKGADSTLLPRLAPTDNLRSQQIIFRTQQHLNMYARQGLRVLVMAKRVISPKKYADWLAKYETAELIFEGRERRMRELYSEMENHLSLIGATGIEDLLQEGVPETISALRSAGIVVWVLTGDKPETAINIAYSTKLFTPQMKILKLAARSKEAAESTIAFYLREVASSSQGRSANIGSSMRETQLALISSLFKTSQQPQQQSQISNSEKSSKSRALVVDGKTLTYILDRRSNLQKPFLDLTTHCTSVLCCRATPLQKAFIVRIVKEQLHMRTLAIGDGANDVSMIQTADIGIGISGQEGMQAVMASDFSMSRFKYLERFLLVHGHWCYDRLAHMVLYFFYKNATFVFLIFWFQLYCGFSGTVMIDQMYLMLYNLFFTSLPPLILGVYDQDVSEDLLMSKPSLYSKGRLGLVYQSHSFWLTVIDSVYQSLVIFYVGVYAYHDTEIGLWEFGLTIITSCMFAMLIQCCLETRSWTIIHGLSLTVSLSSFYAFCLVYNIVCLQCIGIPTNNVWVLRNTIATAEYWLIVLLSSILALLPRFLLLGLQTCLFPDDITNAVLESKANTQKNTTFLVSWSRSTSTSSIYRCKGC
ncbi:phospholipid-transporting ATPase VD isoform X2 [Bemisia tabaci]|uniref:phospholipid-transporting ATPase VD isoform X2 n=1 Tax=Bemisia tabaci TaxID=7038 RepID=UPI003B281A2C